MSDLEPAEATSQKPPEPESANLIPEQLIVIKAHTDNDIDEKNIYSRASKR